MEELKDYVSLSGEEYFKFMTYEYYIMKTSVKIFLILSFLFIFGAPIIYDYIGIDKIEEVKTYYFYPILLLIIVAISSIILGFKIEKDY